MKKYELTNSQKNIWESMKFAKSQEIGNLAGQLFVDNIELDFEKLNRTVNKLFELYDAYRIKIKEENGEVYQFFSNYEFQNFEKLDLSDISEQERQNLYHKWAKEIFVNDELINFKLLKLSDRKFGVYWKVSHLIADGYTAALTCQKIIDIYSKLLKNEEYEIEKLYSYEMLIDREKQYLEKQFDKDKETYDNLYQSEPVVSKFAINDSNNIAAKRYTKDLGKEFSNDIKTFCSENSISEALFFEKIILIYLRKINNNKNVSVGSPVLNRTNAKERQIFGMFVNTQPFQVTIDDNLTFSEFSKYIKKEKFNLLKRQSYPFTALQKDLKEKHKYGGKLYDVAVSYQPSQIVKNNTDIEFETGWYFTECLLNEMVINIDDRDGTGFRMNFDYKTDLFNEEEVNDILQRIILVSKQVIKNPNIKLSDIQLLISKDLKKYEELNNNLSYEINKTVLDIFDDIVFNNPNEVAIKFKDKEYTYEQINNDANNLANELSKLNLDNMDIVPVVGDKSYYTIISLLAISKIGKAYFLLDEAELPEEKITTMLEDIKAHTVIHYGSNYINFNLNKFDMRTYCGLENNISYQRVRKNSDSIFCALHTSGSTGNPKISLIKDVGVVNMFNNVSDLTGDAKTFISLTKINFDAFLMDVMSPLLSGKKLVLPTYEELSSSSKLAQIVKSENKTVLMQTPTTIKMNLKNINDESYKNVDVIILGGEKFDNEILNLINDKCGNPKVYNTYGPTETTVFNTIKQVEVDNISIGRPANNFKIYLIDECNNVLPPNNIGEMVIIGPGVSAGYINNPEENKKVFLRDKKSGNMSYKSGDFACLNTNNELVFCGRRDNQIKINGVRIELGEIEIAVNGYSDIKLAAVRVEETNNHKYLLCFYEGDKTIDDEDIRRNLSKKLKSNMIPQIFVKIDKMPLTASGKVDKKRLPEFDLYESLKASYIAPETELQKIICNIWEKQFNYKPVGIHTTFSSFGGDSRILIDIISDISKIMKKTLGPVDFAKNPTIYDMVEVLENRKTYKNIDLKEYDIASIVPGVNNNKNDILLTGAGGYLGSHILEYIINNKECNIYCLIRDVEKFKKALKFYFDDKIELDNSRIRVITGDISKTNLGLGESDLLNVKNNVGRIINCAANVSHFASVEEAKKDNVDGIYNMSKMALEIGASLEHMSTITVSGINVSEQTINNVNFTENDLNIGQDYSHDAYMLSKYKAEELLKMFESKNLNYSIYRTGYIGSRSYDNKFQINEDTSAFQMIVNMIQKIGVVPESAVNVKIQTAPVDKIAQAVVELSEDQNKLKTYHLFDPYTEGLFDYLDYKKINYKILKDEEFMIIANKLLDNKEGDSVIVYKYLNGFMNNQTTNSISNEITQKELNKKNLRFK